MFSISVVVPTFNESETIDSQIKNLLDITPNILELIIVDDNSPDNTWKIVEDFSKTDTRVRLIRRINERGLASAIFDGISASRGDIVLWLDCDHNPSKDLLKKILSAFDNGADVCIASRYIRGGKELREPIQRMASRMINLFATLVLESSIHDYTTGFVATKRAVFEKVRWDKKGYGEYCIEFLYKAHQKKFVIKEIPFICKSRERGNSKTNGNPLRFLQLGFNYGIKILKLRFGNR